jgi:hypothetical protein
MSIAMKDREEGRRQRERAEREDLNQGMQTGTYDSMNRRVRWGSSYGRKTVKPKSGL